MSVTDMFRARWRRAAHPGELKPREALDEALRQINEGSLTDVAHVTVVIQTADGVHYLNAGTRDPTQLIGALERAKLAIWTNGRDK